ncbi:MAG TPA: hypothetical protein VGN12_17985 [Pirellulales bacterium]|jgi:hypothetical protein
MNTTYQPAEFEPFESPLAEAVERIRYTLPPSEAVQRVGRRAIGLEIAAPARAPQRYRRLSAYLAGGLAAAAVAALVLTMNSHDAWAQTAKKLRGKAWVHITLKLPDGVPTPDEGLPQMWFSAQARRAANKFGKRARWIDLAQQESWSYDPQEDALQVANTRDSQTSELGFIELLLTLVMAGETDEAPPTTKHEILDRERRAVNEGGRRWHEFSFKCRDPQRNGEWHVTFRVNPQTGLPFEMVSTEKMAANDPAPERTFTLDYPESGPTDIFALGVPRSAKLVDKRRKPAGNEGMLKELLATYARARALPIEPYTCMTLHTTADDRDVHFAFRVEMSHEGPQVRTYDLDQLIALRQRVWSKELKVPADAEMWWQEQILKMPLTEGAHAHAVPHQVGFPTITGHAWEGVVPEFDNPDVVVTLEDEPKMGPAGTKLVRVRLETAVGFNDAAYWIAPDRGHMILRQDLRFKKEREPFDVQVWTIDETAQSPRGRWYATRARVGRVTEIGDELAEKGGEITTSRYRYLVDFE